ncbi:MAG: nitroreductase family protein [Candidatus Lambdaproteobacteria bacterium]|nr:nitroreductase family protein [Candidatus Lambdaproteobacteria bacterium]
MSSQDRLTMPVGEAMFTQRSIRRLRPDSLPLEDIRVFLEAAVKAPNGGNAQPGRFLVVTERKQLKALGALYHEAWWAKRKEIQGWHTRADIPPTEKTYLSASRLADEIGDAPLIVLPCAKRGTPGNSVFPWVQNMMLAARALGIGSVFTTLHPQVMERVMALFALPQDVEVFGCVPMGYPRGKFGPTARKSIGELTYFNRWGQPSPWA